MVQILLFWPVLAVLGPSLEGCVLPIGPDFQNPPPATPIPELPPYFGVANPQLETVVNYGTLTMGASQTFEVAVTDPNPGDAIFVRWIVNYPPYGARTNIITSDMMMHAVDSDPAVLNQFMFIKKVSCMDVMGAADPTLSIVVADRPWVSAPNPDDENRDSYYQDEIGIKQTFVVGTWRIAGCL